jgi:hypothetical protein
MYVAYNFEFPRWPSPAAVAVAIAACCNAWSKTCINACAEAGTEVEAESERELETETEEN